MHQFKLGVTRLVAIVGCLAFRIATIFVSAVVHYNLFTSKKLFDMLQTKLRDVDVAAFDGAIDGDQLVLDIGQSNSRLPHQTVLVRLAACAGLAEEVGEAVHQGSAPPTASCLTLAINSTSLLTQVSCAANTSGGRCRSDSSKLATLNISYAIISNNSLSASVIAFLLMRHRRWWTTANCVRLPFVPLCVRCERRSRLGCLRPGRPANAGRSF